MVRIPRIGKLLLKPILARINRVLGLFGLCLSRVARSEMYQAELTRSKVQPSSLLWFWGNIFSQKGQDGILREIFSRLGITRGTFVEFGGWDGVYLSNCRLLYEKGWRGVFIETDKKKFSDLKRNYSGVDKVVCVNELVSVENSLDKILKRHVPFSNVDFVSIDIDGLDLEVAQSSNLAAINPKVFIIEGGFAFDPRLTRRIPREVAAQNVGQPLQLIINEFGLLGYEPVCFFQDVYFVRKDFVGSFSDIRRDAVSLFMDAFNFMDDGYRQRLLDWRDQFGAGIYESEAGINFLEGIR